VVKITLEARLNKDGNLGSLENEVDKSSLLSGGKKSIGIIDEEIGEIVNYIILNKGPDSKGRAHPTKKIVRYSILEQALEIIHGLYPEFDHIKAYHFKDVNRIWHGKQGAKNAKEAMGEVISALMERHDWSISELIQNISFRYFKDHVIVKKRGIEIKCNVQCAMKIVHEDSPSAVVLDWIKNNEDEDIRKNYGHIKVWYFGTVPLGTWRDEKGRKNAIEMLHEFIPVLMEKYFLNPFGPYKFMGFFLYTP